MMNKYWFYKISEGVGVECEETYSNIKMLDKDFIKINENTILTTRPIDKELFKEYDVSICDFPLTSLNVSSFLSFIFQQGYTARRINFLNEKSTYINGILSIFDDVHVKDVNLKNELLNKLLREIRYQLIEEENPINSIIIKEYSIVKDTPTLFELHGFDSVSINEDFMMESLELLSKIN